MYTLNKPEFAVTDVLALCIQATTDPDLADRLSVIASAIQANEPNYEMLAATRQLNMIPRLMSLGSVTKDELVSLYSEHLSAPKGVARAIYNAIKNAAINKLCPLCSIGSVAHIDHHLPKSRYPDLSVLPLNLIPACHFCNDSKKARFPKTAGEQTFHPYYDAHLLSARWVDAILDYGTPLIVSFSVKTPSTWPLIDRERAERHFKICGLGTSFGTSANANLVSLKRRLQRLSYRGGAVEVRAYLEEERDCHDNTPNSWQHVYYHALATDAWFVNGGFSQIADPQP